jgi:hypothetical protein
MVTRSIVFVLSLLLLGSARADVQFAPKESSYDVEGIRFQQLAFSDGSGKEITYQQPTGWNYSGSSAKLTLHPPNKGQAEGTITKVALPKPGPFDDESLKELVKQALASVPNDSTDVNIVSQEKNPVKIGGKETFLVIVAYIFYGERYERSMMFMNRGAEQIRFQFVSRAVDFQDLQRAFLASQFSWQNL